MDISEDTDPHLYQNHYSHIIATLQALFDGDDTQIRSHILTEIHDCIAHQRFEYAQVLKQVYTHLDLFVEKQTVVIDDPGLS